MSVAEIVRECVANSARHGKAAKASVDISAQDGLVIVTVIDNGLGACSDAPLGLGSHMMNELCLAWSRVSGEVNGIDGSGTKVEAKLLPVGHN